MRRRSERAYPGCDCVNIERSVEGVGFDLDGTLFDHHGSARDGVRSFLSNLGVVPAAKAVDLWFVAEEVEFEHWRAGRIGFQEQRRRRLRTVLTTLGVDFVDEADDLDQLFGQYLVEYRRAWRLFPETVEVLAALRDRGHRLGLLTNGSEEQQLDKLYATGLAELFDAVCISEAIGFQKPDPRAFEALARSLDVEPNRCLFVGDNPDQDVAGAASVGMRAILIERCGNHARGLFAVIDSMPVRAENQALDT